MSRGTKSLQVLRKGVFISMLFFSLNACWEFDPKTPPPPPPPPQIEFPEPVIPEQYSKGSLFREGSSLFAYADNRARYKGDLITVKIVETYQSSNNVKQGSGKSSSIRAGINRIFGYENQFQKTLPLPSGFDPTNLVDANISSSTSGQGQTQRESRILATIGTCIIDARIANRLDFLTHICQTVNMSCQNKPSTCGWTDGRQHSCHTRQLVQMHSF